MPASKPPLVFMPGLGATSRTYAPLLRKLAADYRIYPADHSLDFPQRLTDEFFLQTIDDAAPAGTFRLLAHSLGGGIALRYTARHPERVTKVIAVVPVLFPFRRESTSYRLSSLRLSSRGDGLRHFRNVVVERSRVMAAGRREQLYTFAGTLDLVADLPNIERGTLLWPEHEEVIPRWQLERARELNSRLSTETVPGSHNSLALDSRSVLAKIQEVLRG